MMEMDHLWQSCVRDAEITLYKVLSPLQDIDPERIQIQLYKNSFNFANLRIAQNLVSEFLRRDDLNTLDYGLSRELVSNWLAKTLRQVQLDASTYGHSDLSLSEDSKTFIRETFNPNRIDKVHAMLERLQGTMPWEGVDAEKDAMRASVRKFSDEVIAPVAAQIHRQDEMIPPQILDGVRALGCFGFSVPMEYGGLKPGDGEDTTGMVVVTEELSRGSLGAAGSLITRPEIIVRALLEGGTEAQRRRWLPGLAAGNPLCAVSVTEPNTGSDVASVALRASKVPGGWLLNGEKTWCTFAGKAELVLVLARTDQTVLPPHRGLSLFVVNKPSTDEREFTVKSRGGSLWGKAIPTLGYRGMHSFSMHYDSFFVPDENLVGEEDGLNRGFYYTMRGFSGGRLQTAARAIGLMQASYEAAFAYTGDRIVFERPIRNYQLTRMKLIDMATAIVAIRRYAYQVASMMDKNEGQLEASLVKLVACRAAETSTREALQLHGGIGYAEESSVSRYFVDARVLSIFEGAEETLALKVVGRSLLHEIEKFAPA